MTTTADPLDHIRQRIDPLRAALLNHPVYQHIDGLRALRLFMEYHVFAVWDFMSLLKALQQKVCCVDVPWLPIRDAAGSRLINEIVLAEESDEDRSGGFASHFELYYRAMRECGAKTEGIDTLLEGLRRGKAIGSTLQSPSIPTGAGQFVLNTFAVIEGGSDWSIASAFTFGREDLLPEVFERIVDQLSAESSGGLEEFRYYLERHIGLDGDEHGPMAHRLLRLLCGSDDFLWIKAEEVAASCLEARLRLWNAIDNAIMLDREGHGDSISPGN